MELHPLQALTQVLQLSTLTLSTLAVHVTQALEMRVVPVGPVQAGYNVQSIAVDLVRMIGEQQSMHGLVFREICKTIEGLKQARPTHRVGIELTHVRQNRQTGLLTDPVLGTGTTTLPTCHDLRTRVRLHMVGHHTAVQLLADVVLGDECVRVQLQDPTGQCTAVGEEPLNPWTAVEVTIAGT